MKKRFLSFVLIAFFLLQFIVFSSAADEKLFGDFVFEVSPTGVITISADTNYPPLENLSSSDNFTFKDKDIWTLNISTNETFDYYVYEIRMPKGTEIISMNDESRAKVFSHDKLIILGDGKDEKMDINVEYTIDPVQSYMNIILVVLGIFVGGIITLGIVIFILKKKSKKMPGKVEEVKFENSIDNKDTKAEKAEKAEKVGKEGEGLKIDLSIYPSRQQDILKLIMEKGKISQRDVEKKMKIPSSSVSRNIRSLVVKKIIVKERIGQTNYISINDEVLK